MFLSKNNKKDRLIKLISSLINMHHQPFEICNDLNLNNVLQHCFDFKTPLRMIEVMNTFLNHIW